MVGEAGELAQLHPISMPPLSHCAGGRARTDFDECSRIVIRSLTASDHFFPHAHAQPTRTSRRLENGAQGPGSGGGGRRRAGE